MSDEPDFYGESEALLDTVLERHIDRIKQDDTLYLKLQSAVMKLLRYHYQKTQDEQKFSHIQNSLWTALFNADLNNNLNSLLGAAEKHAEKLHKKAVEPKEVKREPAIEAKPIEALELPTSPEEAGVTAEEEPESSTPHEEETVPKHLLSDLQGKQYYDALLKQGGEIAHQTRLYAQRYFKAAHTIGQFGDENWQFKVALQSIGIPANEISDVLGRLKYHIQNRLEKVPEVPQLVKGEEKASLPSFTSSTACYHFLKSQSGILPLATDYIIQRHIDEEGKFQDPGRGFNRERNHFHRLLASEFEIEEGEDSAQSVFENIVQYAHQNAAKIHQSRSNQRGQGR